MKSREQKQEDLKALIEKFKNSTSAMVLSFNKLTVAKDQEFRNELRETGAKYQVVKNTLARIAVDGTPFEEVKEHFKGVTSVAWTEGEPVDLSKVVSKYIKDEKDVFEFKAGVVDGKVVDLNEVKTIASLPSKEELISKLLFLLKAPAQGIATVLNAVPRDLAIVLKQVSERTDNLPGEEAKAEEPKEEKSEDKKEAETKEETPKEEAKTEESSDEKTEKEETPKEDSSEEKSDEQKKETAKEKSED